ncbi:MAG: AsmA-like C-terminal region-containing protein [Betaproteobacteria bacterium]|nr:AsmA-like C-terminal region-containing protein [Betaproteobacteria bacterium]MDH5222288.1 AsmA-like C-terminal region-containing protein [Betaproteobacteria bacterium]
MNPTAIYSKTGKGVQEASGKTSFLSRGDRAILAAIDGKMTVQQLGAKFDRAGDDKFIAVLRKMDADGFIREVSPGTVQRGAANAPRSVPTKPPGGGGGGEDLDFTQIFSAPPKMERPSVAPKVDRPSDPMAAARQEAEMRARQEREAKARAEAAAKQTSDAAQRERLDAEARAKAAREATMAAAAVGKTRAQIEAEQRAEQEGKMKAEMAARAAAEMAARAQSEAARAKEEAARVAAERQVRDKALSAERVRFEAAERARREAEELRRKLEDERRAREEAERRAREEADRTRREAEERARREEEERRAREEAEALRQKLEEERRAREEAERRAEEERQRREQERAEEERRLREEYARQEAEIRAREAEERKEAEEHQRQIRLAREAEDKKRRDADARKKKEEEARRWEAEQARRSSDEGYRQRAEQEDRERAAREAEEAAERAEAERRAAEAADQLAGSLLAELDSFSQRQEEEHKELAEQEKRERAAAEQRAREEQERQARAEEERRARKAEEKRQREAEERRKAEEEAQRKLEEEQRLKEEAIAREQKAREEEARRRARGDSGPADANLGGDDSEGRRLSPEARKALRAREREVARARNRGDIASGKAAAAHRRKAPSNLGKSIALLLVFSLILGAGAANLVPLDASEYERAASTATGLPVKVRAARLRVLTGVEIVLERVTVGDVLKAAEVRMVPELGALLGTQKAYSSVTLVNAELKQSALGGALLSGMQQGPLRVARVVTSGLKLDGPVALPAFDIEASMGAGGRASIVKLSGERLNGLITPRDKVVGFDVTMATFTLPFAPKLTIVEFGMKGSADAEGMTVASFDGRLLEGTVVGSARVQWGQSWDLQGQIQGRTMNAAVFAPQLVAEGRFDGRGRFTMAGAELAKLLESLRLDGTFTVTKGALGAFDLSRALQASSAQASGRTPFTELQGSASYAGGTLALRELRLSSGLLRGAGTLDVDPKGALSGRVNAELRNLRGTYYIGGTLNDPQLRR